MKSTINCKGKILSLADPLVMGIINATPDSFYQGHLKNGVAGILSMAEQMITDGAAILDIGGQSTRPGSERIPVDEELKRILPVIEAIHRQLPGAIIAVDTHLGCARRQIENRKDLQRIVVCATLT